MLASMCVTAGGGSWGELSSSLLGAEDDLPSSLPDVVLFNPEVNNKCTMEKRYWQLDIRGGFSTQVTKILLYHHDNTQN